MNFTIETEYDQRSLAAMSRAIRKTVRKGRNLAAHILGFVAILFGMLMFVIGGRGIGAVMSSMATWFALLLILVMLFFEDRVNAYFAGRHMMSGMEHATTTFSDDGFTVKTSIAESDWHYEKIKTIAELPDFFVFIYSKRHAQVYDKNHISGGTADEFRSFIEEKTGLKTVRLRYWLSR